MSNLPVNKDQSYIHKMWDTTKLVTDYQDNRKVIQEIMHDDIPKNKYIIAEEMHKKISNDNDYDDWDYGTEPSYGHSW